MRISGSVGSLARQSPCPRQQTGTRWLRLIVLAAGLLISRPPAISAQQQAPPDADEEPAPTTAQRLPTDRKTIQYLAKLRAAIAAGQASTALDDFRTLQTADPLTLVPSQQEKVYIPLFRALFELAFQLPAEERRALMETEAARVERQLAIAVADGDLESISNVVLAGAGTNASIDAHWVVARLHLAKGNETAARTWLLPLTGPGLPDSTQQSANRLLQRLTRPDTNAATAGESPASSRPAAPADPSDDPSTDSPAEVDERSTTAAPPQNSLPAASPAAPSSAATDRKIPLPENLMWQSRPNISPRLRGQIDVFLQSALATGFAPQSTWQEILETDRIFRRSLRGLTCIDAKSGQTIWEYPLLPPVEPQITSALQTSPAMRQVQQGNPVVGFTSLDSSPFVSVFCRDNSIGRLAADRDALYLIQFTPDYLGASRSVPQFMPFGTRAPKREGGQLIAVEKSSGRRIWTLAESALEEQLGPSSSSGWFAGPPLAEGRFLYTVFEWDGEMRLGCINRSTGELRWSSVLAFPEQTIDRDPVRSLWGCTPVRREGLIWCPTTTGWLTCIDEATQSIVFATEINELAQDEPRIRIGRNQPVVFTRSASLRDRWSVSRMIPTGEQLIIASPESRDLVWIDAASGKQLHRLPVEAGEILIHADASRLLLSNANRIRGLATASGDELWRLDLTDVTGFPFGQGTLENGRLVVPMSTGCMSVIDLQAGTLTQTSGNILPTPGWGRLESLEDGSGDLYYLAADRLWRLSQVPTKETSGDPLEIAQGLLDSGAWQQALQVAENAAPGTADSAQLEAVIFTARLQLAAMDPNTDLQQIRSMPLTAEQRLQLTALDACLARQRNDLPTSIEALLQLVQQPMEFLRAPAPAVCRNWPTSAASGGNIPQESLLTWVTCGLTDILNAAPAAAPQLAAFEDCPIEVLARIRHPAVHDQLRARLQQTDSLDQWFRLLRQTTPDTASTATAGTGDDPADPNAGSLDVSRDLLQQQLTALVTSGRCDSPMQRLMLRTVVSEMGPPFAELAAQIDAPAATLAPLQAALQAQFAGWTSTEFQQIPVNRSAAFGQQARVYPVRGDDPFLSRYAWSVVRGSSGRMQAVSLEDPTDRWSIPGNVQAYGTYSGWSDQLYRIGSVVLLRTSRSLTAVSVFDQRVLWRRNTFQSGVSRVSSFRGNFTDFDGRKVPLPTHTNMPTYQVVGHGDSWICIHHGNSVEVLDIFNGATYWSLNLEGAVERVLATDEYVVVQPRGAAILALETLSGRPLPFENAEKVIERGILPTPDGLVMWQQRESGERQLEWIDPLSGQVNRTVSLAGMQHFHFLDDVTLAGLHPDQKFTITDLLTGAQQTHSFAVADGDLTVMEAFGQFDLNPIIDGATPPNAEPPPLPANGPPAADPWSTERVVVVRDPCHYFVTNHPPPAGPSFRAPFGRNCSLIVEGLRMIDRGTGQLIMALQTPDRLVASTDQPELGLLVLMTESTSTASPAGMVPSLMTGWSRVTGRQLFRQVTPSRYGSRFVDFRSPEANILDIALQGFRMRLDGTAAAE